MIKILPIFTRGLLNQLTLLCAAILLTGGISSCKKEQEKPTPGSLVSFKNDDYSFPDDSFFVPQSEVVGIATKYTEETFTQRLMKEDTKRELGSIYPLLDREGKPALYVINYANEEGTIIFSADFRFEPVVYFSTSGSIHKPDIMPAYFYSIISVYIKKIEALRYEKNSIEPESYAEQFNLGMRGWMEMNDLSNHCCLHPIPYPGGWDNWDPCANFNWPAPETTGPLMTTEWRQSSPYNSECTIHNNSAQSCYGQRALVGCVAVAVGQVVKYTEPGPTFNNFNYALMPDRVPLNAVGTDAQRMLGYIHDYVKVITACEYTFSTTAKARDCLEIKFGISSATRDGSVNSNSESIRDRLINQIKTNRWPVIIGGVHTPQNQIPWPQLSGAHAWVCDGYQYLQLCVGSRRYFHMNWGWGLSNLTEGWCLWNQWQPTGDPEYNSFLSMVYNIHN